MGRNKNQEIMNRRRFSHGNEAIQIAKNNNCRVSSNGGSHHVVYEPNGKEAIPVPNKELGTGLGAKIFKWYIKWGLLPTLLYLAYTNYLV